jgi:hypothetical protein
MLDFGGADFFFFENMTVTGTTIASTAIARRIQSRYRRWLRALGFALVCCFLFPI